MSPKYKFIYFNGFGLGEPIRFLFAYGGIDFEDDRFSHEEWPKIKEKMPFGQTPVLEIDGQVINQSVAIARYVAKQVKLAGKDDLHALQIDAMVDNITDLRLKIANYFYEADEQLKEKKRGQLINETLPYLLEKLNDSATGGFLVGNELTWADLYFVAILYYLNYMANFTIVEKYKNLQAVRDRVNALPAIKEWIEKRPKGDLY